MGWGFRRKGEAGSGFMTRLARDTRGNTIAIMAAFLVPLAAMTGSAVDVGRMYLTKVRLQQACDAGVLAGRKFMIDSNDSTLDPNAVTQAKVFFANNFPSGLMGTPAFTATTNPYPFTPTKTAENQVAGTATTKVPMTIMKMFGQLTQTLTVTCEARYDIADTDVMFVLDTTGSMACTPSGSCSSSTAQPYTRPDGTTGYAAVEVSGSKISGLRSAVMNFYDTMAANIDPKTNVRYGFVTYTSTVNAGYALPAGSLVSQWTYQSRSLIGDVNNGSYSDKSYSGDKQADCNARAGRLPAVGYNTDGSAILYTIRSWTQTSGNGNNAKGDCVVRGQPLKPNWRYQPVTLDVSQYTAGSTNIIDPSKVTGAKSARWQGCLEERTTTPGATSFDPDNLPADLDPDLAPTNDDSRWRPMWPDVVYYRPGTGSSTSDFYGSSTTPVYGTYGDYWPKTKPPAKDEDGATTSYTNLPVYAGNGWDNNIQSGYVSCGKPVQRLTPMSRSEVSSYVNAADFKAHGGTYHDTGMIWGTRLISPTGLFADDTKAWPGRQPPNRYIVFMTDGDMSPNASLYGMYGIEKYDQRVSNGNYLNLSTYTAYHNARFLAECTAARNRGITVFVIAFGQTLTQQLTDCASQGQAYFAGDNDSLTAAFQQIAKQVAMLRVSK